MTHADFSAILPEFLLTLFSLGAILVGAFAGKDRTAPVLMWATAAVYVLLAFLVSLSGPNAHVAFFGMFVEDEFARFTKVMILLSGAAVLVISQSYLTRRGLMLFEYPILISLSIVGMMITVSAGDLIALYMGIELQSLALYVVASLRRDSPKSSEAGMKYFVLGALSSGMLLYGASLTYGYAGTTQFAGILSTLGQGMPIGLLFGLVFMLAGIAFKISAAPFHMWTPDVYEGAPTPVTAFFATAPKVAGLAFLARLVFDAFGSVPGDWGQVLAVIAVLSIFIGSVAGIGQTDLKRLMAYSSISHMGFALMGLATGTAQGVQAMLIYIAIYVVMSVGTFAFMLTMARDGVSTTRIDSLSLYARKEPGKALALLALFMSMAGVPPFIGFFAKFYVLKAAVDAGLTWLALLGVLGSVVAAYYYLRVVFLMYFGKEESTLDAGMGRTQWVFLMASAAIMLVGVVNLFGIEGAAAVAAQSLVR
ncbi:NADH-quinone oxidoreductase subunit NuoN [Falsirhodobacter sp. 20TX0035]|uniref:NADH-quinone oxidoreductase subunit NuoN n=1 Tax=Falsirhodobacter sp. 20TX0035 TaxID=3022019 RepID=UPI00232C32DF|nr:NADH-quinone oxidoreductase subunit NuoN [Falsirhodobacter sp. 20TX0035]MDB6454354.1 NADH-quinone oxidoreductase subunit NuoN [Falsirhodobacter sp. 20TX0035]